MIDEIKATKKVQPKRLGNKNLWRRRVSGNGIFNIPHSECSKSKRVLIG
jgi:hypothetical protein